MSPNAILLDAAYIDRVAAAFRQHFGGELQRELPKADLAQWLVCTALDAGFAPSPTPSQEGEMTVQCILVHDRETKVMAHVTPGNFSQELDGQAFTEPGLGEFTLACCPVERVTTLTDLCAESLETLLEDKAVRRVAVVYDFDGTTAESRTLTKRIVSICRKHAEACAKSAADAEAPTPKDVTLFTMQPLEGEGFAQQVLGYGLLAALGIAGDELQA